MIILGRNPRLFKNFLFKPVTSVNRFKDLFAKSESKTDIKCHEK